MSSLATDIAGALIVAVMITDGHRPVTLLKATCRHFKAFRLLGGSRGKGFAQPDAQGDRGLVCHLPMRHRVRTDVGTRASAVS